MASSVQLFPQQAGYSYLAQEASRIRCIQSASVPRWPPSFAMLRSATRLLPRAAAGVAVAAAWSASRSHDQAAAGARSDAHWRQAQSTQASPPIGALPAGGQGDRDLRQRAPDDQPAGSQPPVHRTLPAPAALGHSAHPPPAQAGRALYGDGFLHLIKGATKKQYEAGEYFFRKGDRAQLFYVILSGEASVIDEVLKHLRGEYAAAPPPRLTAPTL